MHFYVQWLVFIISFCFSAQHPFQVFKKTWQSSKPKKGIFGIAHLQTVIADKQNYLAFSCLNTKEEKNPLVTNKSDIKGLPSLYLTGIQSQNNTPQLQRLKRDYVTSDRRNKTFFLLQMSFTASFWWLISANVGKLWVNLAVKDFRTPPLVLLLQ